MQPCEPITACDPVILIPGVMGSRLREHARTPGSFETISRHTWLPESHRLLQRSAALGPLSAAQYRAWLNGLNPRKSQPGVRVEPDRRSWGLKGVACLLKAGRECVSTAKVFWDMIAALERAGYRAGTNLFGVPFDWRKLPTENSLCTDLARTLHYATNSTATGADGSGRARRPRKALLVVHSLGNLQLLYCMQRVYNVETLTRIRSLVSIAPPWTGSPKVVQVRPWRKPPPRRLQHSRSAPAPAPSPRLQRPVPASASNQSPRCASAPTSLHRCSSRDLRWSAVT